eukprot:TRINITY_DN38242_c0_g1_i1.p1 TRINITY_DN38242_c0_g1~~TRINITY_DN38242_c0_g1_i1.p1  ORF type:complete len:383 (+),score=56.50 TRINITY_DN38242_c0_g1_i1:2-1150(+)
MGGSSGGRWGSPANKQNPESREVVRRFHEKQKLLNSFHSDDSGHMTRSRTPPERSRSAGSTAAAPSRATAITISPPRSRKVKSQAPSQDGGGSPKRSKYLKTKNYDFFRKPEETPASRLKYEKSEPGVEIYQSPRRLAYDDKPRVDDPVLATSTGFTADTPPTIGLSTPYSNSVPFSQIPQGRRASARPPQEASDTAREQYLRRVGKHGTEIEVQGPPPQPHPRMSAFQHSAYESTIDPVNSTDHDADAFQDDSVALVPRERQLDTSEVWPTDPSMRARTTPHRKNKSCACSTSPYSLGRSYNCTACNSPCCMDCYWTGKCVTCKDTHVSVFKYSDSPNLLVGTNEERFRSFRPLATGKRIRNRTKRADLEYTDRLIAKLSA